MKASEARLGNHILFGSDGIEFKVIGIDQDGFNVENKTESTWIETDQFEGIKLTEEWLLKFGFVKDDTYPNAIFESNNEDLFAIQADKSKWHHIWDGSYTVAPMEYVHQLQNLYFALTGTELEIA